MSATFMPPEPDNSTLAGYISEIELAKDLHLSVRTLQRLAAYQKGPPRVFIGRRAFYRVDAVRAWLKTLEPADRKEAKSKRH